MKKLLVALAVVGAGLSVAAYRLSAPSPVPTDDFVTQPVEYGAISETISASATLQPRDAVAVGTDLAGRVVKVFADLHQMVKLGQPLLQLDDRIARLRVEQAQVAIELARSDVVRAEAGREAARVGLPAKVRTSAKENESAESASPRPARPPNRLSSCPRYRL